MSKPLNTRQRKFVENYALKGLSIAESVRRAGYSIASGKIEDASSYGCKLLKQERVKTYLAKLKERVFKETALSIAEKRSFLARAVRQDVTSGSIPGDLIQEVREEVDQQGNVKRVVKLVNKLDALKEDNKMTNVYEDDKQVSNPFLFLVTLSMGKQSVEVLQQGEVMSKGEVRSERVALPVSATTTISVDAELIP